MSERNPYQPPGAELLSTSHSHRPAENQLWPSAFRGPRRRPISLWLLLGLAWGLGIFYGVGSPKHLFEAVTASASGPPLRSIANAGILLLLSGYLVTLAIAIQRRRKRIARGLGSLFLVLVALIVFFGSGGSPPANCGVSCVQGWWLGRLLMTALVLALAVAAGWSSGANRYYSPPQGAASGDDA